LVESGTRQAESIVQDWDFLRGANPRIVAVSISPFGLYGPWASRRANDLVAAAAGGLLYPSGGPDDPPMQGNAHPSYKMAGLLGANAALLGLFARDRGGEGVRLDVSLQESTMMAMVQHLNANMYTASNIVPKRRGIFGPLYRCRDGKWVAVRVRPDRFDRFRAWARQHGGDDGHGRFGESEPDVTGAGEVNSAMARVAASLLSDEVLRAAWDLDLIALPVGRFEEMGQRDHFVETEQFFSVWNPVVGQALAYPRSAVDGMSSGVAIQPAPALGQDNEQILSELSRESPRPRIDPTVTSKEAKLRPLGGVRILDFTWVLAGPFGTRILANFGAEVIRIESHTRRDSVRSMPPGASSLDAAPLYNDANAGKKSITLDLTRPEARELVLQLTSRADVVTNNFRPGALERMGLGYEALKKANPEIILVNLPGCGNRGPWSSRGTLGGVLMAASGLNDISGFDGRPPYGISTAYPDFTSPYLLALGVMAALNQRRQSGHGQEITINQLSATISLLGAEWMRFAAEGNLPRNANRSFGHAPHGVYPTEGADEWCALTVTSDDEWRSLCRLMDKEELAGDSRFHTHEARKKHEDILDNVVASWTCTWDRWALADALQEAGIAAGAVESLADLYDRDPQVSYRHHYQHVRQPNEADFDIVIDGEAIAFCGVERILGRAPMMGEHNEPILRGLLGLTEERFNHLVAGGVID
jgi:crotonobetainyl-CoA:carnitine CoA-transferase CaiB-like acyl-CoA transferase